MSRRYLDYRYFTLRVSFPSVLRDRDWSFLRTNTHSCWSKTRVKTVVECLTGTLSGKDREPRSRHKRLSSLSLFQGLSEKVETVR